MIFFSYVQSFLACKLGSSVTVYDILVRILIRGSMPLCMNSDLDPDPAIFVIDLQAVNKKPVLGIRIHRIHMFLGPPDPDPLVRGMDPDPDPSIIMQK